MTWLAPLYLAGALAVAAPILFHLWRRTPRGTRSFSTLMFLTPSPPRVTSLSHVEHWLLLLLRAAALLLLALAFARPVLRIPEVIPIAKEETEFVAILIDTSASLQREELWPQAVRLLEERLQTLPDAAVIGLFEFHDRWQPQVTLKDSAQLSGAARKAIVRERLQALSPTWRGTDLGSALVSTAQIIQEAQSERPLPCPQRIWLVSDLQAGSQLSALREFDWPADLPVDWLSIGTDSRENAGLQLVAVSADSADDKLRVRLSNAASSTRQRFTLVWGDAEASPCLEAVVPPGQSRVFSLPAPPTEAAGRSVVLHGDDEPFDNRLWLPVRQPRQCSVVFVGDDGANDPEAARFYLERALAANPQYDVSIVDGNQPILSSNPPTLAVVTDASTAARDLLPKLLDAGTDIALVPRSAEVAETLWELCGAGRLDFRESDGSDYALWSEIDFESPWFAPFAEAQFADFSGIHFWRHRIPVGELPAGSQVLVRFDSGVPAVVRWPVSGKTAQVWYFASGWHPRDSQLSRSSKFVPLMWRMLEGALGDLPVSSAQAVGQPIRRPASAIELTLRRPDGTTWPWPVDQSEYRETDEPGRYTLTGDGFEEVVAVNLTADESRTDPLPLEQLEAVGVKLSTVAKRPALPTSADQLRQQQVQELEERQQLWRWVLLAVAGLLVAETLIGNRRALPGVEAVD